MKTKKSCVDRMLETMEEQGIKHGEMAVRLSVSKQTLSMWRRRDSIPKHKMLGVCGLLRINMAWLSNGTGARYDVEHYQTDGQMIDAILELVEDPSQNIWLVHNRADGNSRMIVSSCRVVQGGSEQRAVDYDEINVFTGAINQQAVDLLKEHENFNELALGPVHYNNIITGQLGDKQLIERINKAVAGGIEPHPSYINTEAITIEEKQLLDLFRQLDDDQKKVLKSVAELFNKKTTI